MKAALLTEPYKIQVTDIDLPEPQPGEVRVKLSQVGICGSDVHLFQGHRKLDYPRIIGHEGLGYIDKTGDGVNRKIGERVVIEPNFTCGKCKFCTAGRGNICINKGVLGINLHGCFAEYICVPSSFAWHIPESISDQDAVTIEPTAVAYHALKKSSAQPFETIAIIGLGAIGLLLTHIAKKLGYRVLVSEVITEKLKLATDMGAIPVTVNGTLDEQASQLNTIWNAYEVVSIFECAGSSFTASLATAAATRGSEIILVGLSDKNASFQPLKIAREGISILPSIIYDHPHDFNKVIELISSQTISPGSIISSNYALDHLQLALEKASTGNETKIIINI